MRMGIAVWTYKSVSAPPRQIQDQRLLSTSSLHCMLQRFLLLVAQAELRNDFPTAVIMDHFWHFPLIRICASVMDYNLGAFSVLGIIIGKGMRMAAALGKLQYGPGLRCETEREREREEKEREREIGSEAEGGFILFMT